MQLSPPQESKYRLSLFVTHITESLWVHHLPLVSASQRPRERLPIREASSSRGIRNRQSDWRMTLEQV